MERNWLGVVLSLWYARPVAASFKPSDFLPAVVEPKDNLAEAIKKTYVVLPPFLYKLDKYFFNDDGTLGEQFLIDLCAIVCPDPAAVPA